MALAAPNTRPKRTPAAAARNVNSGTLSSRATTGAGAAMGPPGRPRSYRAEESVPGNGYCFGASCFTDAGCLLAPGLPADAVRVSVDFDVQNATSYFANSGLGRLIFGFMA